MTSSTIPMAAHVEREVFVRSLSLARPTGASARALAAAMEDVRLASGTVIFRADDAPEAAYFVMSGTVELVAPGTDPWTFGRGAVVGILDVMAERPRARTAIVRADALVLRLRADDWLDILEDDFEYTRDVLRGVASANAGVHLELGPRGGFDEPPLDAPTIAEDAPRLGLVERMMVLRDTDLFRRTTIQAITTISDACDELRLPAGAILSDRVSLFAGFSVVARGVVEMTRAGEPELRARFGPASVVGGPFGLAHPPEKLEVRAITDASLLHVRDEDFYDVMEDHFDVARSAFATFALERERLMSKRALGT